MCRRSHLVNTFCGELPCGMEELSCVSPPASNHAVIRSTSPSCSHVPSCTHLCIRKPSGDLKVRPVYCDN